MLLLGRGSLRYHLSSLKMMLINRCSHVICYCKLYQLWHELHGRPKCIGSVTDGITVLIFIVIHHFHEYYIEIVSSVLLCCDCDNIYIAL